MRPRKGGVEWVLGGEGRAGEYALPEVSFPPIPLEDNEGSRSFAGIAS
jgi:hypothetical protein